MFIVEIKQDTITGALVEIAAALDDMTPMMQDIGRILVESTTDRFKAGKSPAGIPWAAKSAVTLATQKGNDTRPLFGPSGMLNSQINRDAGRDFVEVGSNQPYAAMMQFGGTKARFAHLWGDIPARPFLGISETDETAILETIAEYLSEALTA